MVEIGTVKVLSGVEPSPSRRTSISSKNNHEEPSAKVKRMSVAEMFLPSSVAKIKRLSLPREPAVGASQMTCHSSPAPFLISIFVLDCIVIPLALGEKAPILICWKVWGLSPRWKVRSTGSPVRLW